MLTINHITKNNLPLDHILSSDDKRALLEENKSGNFSYICLMKEMFHYKEVSVESLLRGWGGVKIVKL